MGKWIIGNTPKKPGTYFITVNKNGDTYVPWEIYSYDGNTWSREAKYKQNLDKARVLAYMSVSIPEPFTPDYSKPSDVTAYFVRVDYGYGRIEDYGLMGWPKISSCFKNNGFDTVQKARSALKRRKAKDIERMCLGCKYSVVDTLGNVIEQKRKTAEEIVKISANK